MKYITGKAIRELREKQHMTQRELAEKICVSDKTVSKWETDRGLPDVAILEELAKALGASVTELLTGELRENENPAGNMKKVHFYICPVCGNVITAVGQGTYSCCGITLPDSQPECCDDAHEIRVETVENEYHASIKHPMVKKHYISFVAYVTVDSCEVVKLYPEQEVSVRFRKKGHGYLYMYCNRHGLFRRTL